MSKTKTALSKALEINLNTQVYGTFAEIGAGQEVARFFFQAGKASQTIAKTISAYDMIYSDEIYGKEASGRYVSESRLNKMLDKEFGLLQRRLDQTRGKETCFFAFANTVATGDKSKRFTHGWMGIRFQIEPGGTPNDIFIHVRLLDKHRLQQQETLGVLGVNLVYTAFTHIEKIEDLIPELVDGLKDGQVAIDLIKVHGPNLNHFNNHLLNLELVRRGLADAILFGPEGNILNLADEVYQRPVLIQRGTYRPVTKSHVDVLEKGFLQFKTDFPEDSHKSIAMFELTMHNLNQNGNIQETDFLDRVKSLCSLGNHVLVSNFFLYYRLKQFLRHYTQKPMVLIMGASHLENLFDQSHYQNLDGGMLEGLAKLLDEQTRLYIYPHKTKTSCMTTKSFFPEERWLPIYQFFIKQKQICDISGCNEIEEYLHSDDVKELILKNDPSWENLVPVKIRDQIKKENLFNFFPP